MQEKIWKLKLNMHIYIQLPDFPSSHATFVHSHFKICYVFSKAITYLQSAYRLKGEDNIEAGDITEIAGVLYCFL